jgi:hypothetical protein
VDNFACVYRSALTDTGPLQTKLFNCTELNVGLGQTEYSSCHHREIGAVDIGCSLIPGENTMKIPGEVGEWQSWCEPMLSMPVSQQRWQGFHHKKNWGMELTPQFFLGVAI